MTYAHIVRSPYAHATIKSIDTSAAQAAAGVVAVFTGADVAHIRGVPTGWQVNFKNGDTMKEPAHPLLCAAGSTVKHVGDSVAIIIAESRAAAVDAAELLDIDYDVHPCVTNCADAIKDGAPQVHADAPNNTAFDWAFGNPIEEVNAAMASAAHITTLELVNQRLSPNAMEPRSAIGHYDEAMDNYTLWTTSQNPHLTRLLLCAFVLGLPEHKVRVVAPDVGWLFGHRIKSNAP
jgi:aerobic carbon-monoxide dehydrogenase large subunit